MWGIRPYETIVSIPYRCNETPECGKITRLRFLFQFLIGAMRQEWVLLRRGEQRVFQFLIGAMRPGSEDSSIAFGKVSIPYRCNETSGDYIVDTVSEPFQFLIGAMRHGSRFFGNASRPSFQFLIGAMRRRIANRNPEWIKSFNSL